MIVPRRLRYLAGAIVGLVVLALATMSCARTAPVTVPQRLSMDSFPAPSVVHVQPAKDTAQPDSVPLVPIIVQNQTFYDVDVWLLANDAKVRHLGIVSGYTETHFIVRGWSLASGQQLAMYAKARVTDQEYNSPGITIFAGRGLKWLIERPGVEWLTSYQLPAWTN